MNVAYDLVMYMSYPEAVVSRSLFDGTRLIGGGFFAADYGGSGVVLFTFSLVAIAYTRRWLFPVLGLAIAAVCILLSGTRGSAFVAVVILGALLVIRARTFFWRSIIIVGAIAALYLVFLYAGEIDEMLGRNSQSLEGWDGRWEIWTVYLEDFFRTGSIAFGLGMQTGGRFLASAYPDTPFGNMHNMYLEALVDIGVFGLSILVVFLIVLLPSIRVIDRLQNKQHTRELCFCWLIFLAGIVSGLESQGLLAEDIPAIGIVVPYLIIMTMRVRQSDALFQKRRAMLSPYHRHRGSGLEP